jgi:hypothetical protein
MRFSAFPSRECRTQVFAPMTTSSVVLACMDSLRLFVGWLAKSKVIRPGLLGLELRSCLAQSLHLLFSWLLTQENQKNDFNNNP